jgi:DNA-binding CsgD family transcriptional regulator
VALLDPLLAELPAGTRRWEALYTKLGTIFDRQVRRRLLEDTVPEAEGYPSHQMRFLISLCGELYTAQEFDAARERARAAVALAEQTGDPTQLALALSMLGRLDVGIGGLQALQRARDLESGGEAFDAYEVVFDAVDSPATWIAWWLLANDELDGARQLLVEQHRKWVEAGNPWEQAWIDFPLAELECRAGDYDAARAYAEDGAALAEQLDSPLHLSRQLYCRALVAAHVGDAATARASADESLAIAAALHNELAVVRPKIALALLATAERNYAEALEHLEGLTEVALEGPYWATYPFWGDLFEALVAVGEFDRAHALLTDIDTHRLLSQRPGTAPVLARCRGLVLAASGQVDDGIVSLEEALRLQRARPVPLERARTLLALGELQRRSRQRRTARETLRSALATFEELGAALWAERTSEEIARIGGRAPSPAELTPAEQRVAELVAEGKSNKEVAAELVVSVRTVESALTSIYRKLGVRSRTEMARRILPVAASESD